jgi:hypothetical protein
MAVMWVVADAAGGFDPGLPGAGADRGGVPQLQGTLRIPLRQEGGQAQQMMMLVIILMHQLRDHDNDHQLRI